MDTDRLRQRIRYLLLFFVVALVISGATAFPLKWEVDILLKLIGPGTLMASLWPALSEWIATVHRGITVVHEQYAFMFYGTDWLAFAHIVIASAFLAPLRDPVRHVWIVEWGMICCILVIPLALICGPLRGIPFFWRLFDCAFGLFGILPLWLARRDIRQLAEIESGRSLRREVSLTPRHVG
jgi:hypothetical protein